MTTKNEMRPGGHEWLMAIPRLILLMVKLAFDKDVSWETKTAMGAAMLYIVSPIDGIPDFIPLLGQTEDMLLFILLVDGLINQVDRCVILRHWTGRPETLDAIGSFTSRVTALMPSFIRNRVMKKAFRAPGGAEGAAATQSASRPAEKGTGTHRRVVEAG